MKLVFQRIDKLPKLAWCARIDRSDYTIRILHGPYLEVADDFFAREHGVGISPPMISIETF
jgi:hypothetical protein